MPIDKIDQFLNDSQNIIKTAYDLSNEERMEILEQICKLETDSYAESKNMNLSKEERFQQLCKFRSYHKIRLIIYEMACLGDF